MAGFLFRLAIGALGLWLAAKVVPGMRIDGNGTLLAAALLLGIVNAVLRPIAIILSFPFLLVTLGLFLLVVNAAMLGLVAWLLKDFHLAGFVPAVLGSIVVSLTSWFVSAVGLGRRETVIVEHHD